jgi:hypothetical protein
MKKLAHIGGGSIRGEKEKEREWPGGEQGAKIVFAFYSPLA